jgi:hypothetical protein
MSALRSLHQRCASRNQESVDRHRESCRCCATFPRRTVVARRDDRALCATGSLLRLADTFFAAQDKWAGGQRIIARCLPGCKAGGMGKDEFDSPTTPRSKRIAEQRLNASQQLDVNSTPTFFINGSKFSGAPTAEEFNKVLSSLVAKSCSHCGWRAFRPSPLPSRARKWRRL